MCIPFCLTPHSPARRGEDFEMNLNELSQKLEDHLDDQP